MIHPTFVLRFQQHRWQPTIGSPCPSAIRLQFPEVVEIIEFWLSNKTILQRQTSGSTGIPKTIEISRKQLQASAKMTIQYLGLKQNDQSLLCLNAAYIGGTMMVIRAMVAGMHLIVTKATANPLHEIDLSQKIDFAALVPLQMMEIIKDANAINIQFLKSIKNIIIGGAAVDEKQSQQLHKFPNNIYSTFGMTETVSHFALKMIAPVNKDYFETLPGIEIAVRRNKCLKVKGEVTDNKWLYTNDLVTIINSNRFIWEGREDYVINSGGIKIQPEQLERKIQQFLPERYRSMQFFIGSEADERLGYRIVLFIESTKNDELERILSTDVFTKLSKFEKPKNIRWAEKFEFTASGKINRINTLKHFRNDDSK